MSYCVNCGVELDASAKKCVLCDTPVINPNNIGRENPPEKPFADEVQIPPGVKRRFVALIVTMVMLIPNVVLFLINACFYRGQNWSIYILATTLLVWVLAVFPFFTKKIRPYLMWAVDTAAAAAYCYVFIATKTESAGIVYSVFSMIALISVASLILTAWCRKKQRHWTAVLVHVLIDAFVISFAGGLLVSAFSGNENMMIAGIICAACFFCLAGFFIYCNRSKHVRAWLNKAFNI